MTDLRLDARYLDRLGILLEYIRQCVAESRHRSSQMYCMAAREHSLKG